MAGTSRKTKVYAVRLPIEIGLIAEQRVAKWNSEHRVMTIGGYLRERLTYGLTRSHHKRRKKNATG